MDTYRPWDWRQQWEAGYPPPIPNDMNSFAYFIDPNSGRGQPVSQPWGPSGNQPRLQDDGRERPQGFFQHPSPGWPVPPTGQQPQQNDVRARGQERYLTPSQRRRQQRQRRRANEQSGERRAPTPSWSFTGQGPLPFPVDNPSFGPFASTRPMRRNDAHFRTSSEVTTTAVLPPRPVPRGNGHPPPNQGDRDPITPPSAASGGIPEPTAAYLVRASFAPMLRTSPQPLLVVIDLNGTLLHRPQKRAATKFVERPLARAFLERCIDKHRVVIWSSARPENVRHMCARLLTPEYASRVVAVWGRDRFGLSPSDYNRRTQCYKRLTRLWEDSVVRASHPLAEQGGMWNQGNTVLIDDSAEKARSEPHNAVTLPEFVGDMNEDPQVLTLVEEYLETLAWQTDVSTYIRSRPFVVGRSGAAVAVQKEG